jgi:hypothetical protein
VEAGLMMDKWDLVLEHFMLLFLLIAICSFSVAGSVIKGLCIANLVCNAAMGTICVLIDDGICLIDVQVG